MKFVAESLEQILENEEFKSLDINEAFSFKNLLNHIPQVKNKRRKLALLALLFLMYSDMVIAYNWGIGNLIKYKKGKKKLPNQSRDYVKILNVLKKHFLPS